MDLLQRNPGSAEAHFLLGVLHTQKRDHMRARQWLLKASRLRPSSVPILNNLGVNALHLGQEEKAERYFRQALSIEAANDTASFNLGLLELKRQRFAEAAGLLRKSAARRAGDLPTLQALLAAEMEAGLTQGVEECTERILRLAAEEPAVYVQLGTALAGRGFQDLAVRVLERARRLQKSNGQVHAVLGDLYEKQGRYDQAVQEYQAAVRLNPENEEYHYRLGQEFLIHHNFTLAEQLFSASLRTLSQSARLRLGLSAAYFGLARYPDAVEVLREIIEMSPEYEPAYFLLGKASLLLAGHEALFGSGWVSESFSKYLALKPREGFPHLLVAREELRAQRPGEASRLLNRAIELDPDLAEAWLELGKSYFDRHQYAEAIRAFRKAVEIVPSYVEAHYRLARTYQRIGDEQKARLAWQEHARRQKEMEASVNQRDKQILRFIYTLK